MRTSRVKRQWARVRRGARAAVRYWRGDDEYQGYLERCAALQVAPLDRGRYFAERLEEKYRGGTRCC